MLTVMNVLDILKIFDKLQLLSVVLFRLFLILHQQFCGCCVPKCPRDKEVQGTCLGMRDNSDKEVKGYMSRNA